MAYVAVAGFSHSLFLDPFGSVWCCGNNHFGQLGLGDTTKRKVPCKIPGLPQILSVSAGYCFSTFLDVDGNVWVCGDNEYGQLGLGDNTERTTPCQITNIPKIQAITSPYNFNLFLDFEGSVWACGNNTAGAIGLGKAIQFNRPVKITGLPKIVQVSGGGGFSLFLDFEGYVWSSGCNGRGSLGLGDTSKRIFPYKITTIPRIQHITGGIQFSLFTDIDGNVWATGSNNRGELGLGDATLRNRPFKINSFAPVTTCAAGYYCSLFLDKGGNVYTCGNNSYGQLGLGDIKNRSHPHKINNLPPIASIAKATMNFFLFVDVYGTVWGSGDNEYGQLGLGDTTQRNSPVKIEGLPKLTVQEIVQDPGSVIDIEREENMLKELFKLLSKEQSKSLAEKLKLTGFQQRGGSSKREFLKEQFLTGIIPMVDWGSHYNSICNRKKELAQNIQQNKTLYIEKQKELEKIREQIDQYEKEKEVFEFFDKFLYPIVVIEKEVTHSFQTKLQNPKDFSVDDVSVFLNVCELEHLIPFQRAKQINGEQLLFYSSVSDIAGLGINDSLTKKRLKFFGKLLENGLLLRKDILEKSVIWRHLDINKTLVFLKEYGIPLDRCVIEQKSISLCQLIFFKSKDFREFFGMLTHESVPTLGKFSKLRKEFSAFLQENRISSTVSR